MAHNRTEAAFTRTELVVVIAVLLVFILCLLPRFARAKQRSGLSCVNNLQQIGLSYRIWANDNGDRFPSSTPFTNGGWSNLLSRADASTYVWTNYLIMANEMGQNPKTLVCPTDERKPAQSFSNLANTNISYFVPLGADNTYPQSILAGDRNLGPGTKPDHEYGYSPANGRGNDVIIKGPVCWSLKMHSRENAAGAGNILLGDGSVQEVTSQNLNVNWFNNALTNNATTANATNSPGLRLIFP